MIDDRGGFDAAIRDLTEAGFDESALEIRYGQVGIDTFDARHRHSSQRAAGRSKREGHYAIRVRILAPDPDYPPTR